MKVVTLITFLNTLLNQGRIFPDTNVKIISAPHGAIFKAKAELKEGFGEIYILFDAQRNQ